MVGAMIKQPLQPNVQSSDQLDVPVPQTSLLTPPETPLPATNHLPPSPNPTYPTSTSPQKANSTIITSLPITLTSKTPSTAPSTVVGIEIRTCGRPLNPNAPPFVPAHLRTGTVAPQLPKRPTWTQTSPSTWRTRIDAKAIVVPLQVPISRTWTPGVQTSSSTGRTRIDTKSLPDWRSSSIGGHGGLDYALRSRRKLLARTSSTTSGSSSANFIDWMSVSADSGANSP